MKKPKPIRLVSFILIFVGVFVYLNRIFASDNHFNNSIEAFEELSSETNIDVLFFGSSHSYTAFNPLIINQETKTTSFNLGSDGLLVPLTDLIAKEALQKTKPKLVVLEIYPPSIKSPTSKKSKGYQLRVLDRISHFSISKWEKTRRFYNPSELIGVYMPLVRNHAEWDKIKPFKWSKNENFNLHNTFFYNGYKGNTFRLNAAMTKTFKDFRNKKPKAKSTNKKNIITSENKKDIDNFIMLSKSHGAEVLLVSAPDLRANYNWDPKFFTLMQSLSDEHDVMYINLNNYYDQIDLQTVDFKDPSHLNVLGAYKTSKFLGKYIANTYDLPNRSYEKNFKELNNDYSAFIEKHIKIQEWNHGIQTEESFLPNIMVDSITLEKQGARLKFSLALNAEKTSLEELKKYNLLVKLIPEAQDTLLVHERFKMRGWNFDKTDIDLQRVSSSIDFVMSTRIKAINTIEFILYNKEGYDGAVGKRIKIRQPIFD